MPSLAHWWHGVSGQDRGVTLRGEIYALDTDSTPLLHRINLEREVSLPSSIRAQPGYPTTRYLANNAHIREFPTQLRNANALVRLGDLVYAKTEFGPSTSNYTADLWGVNLIRPSVSARIGTITQGDRRAGSHGLTTDGTNLYTAIKGFTNPDRIVEVNKDTGAVGDTIATLTGIVNFIVDLIYHDNGFYLIADFLGVSGRTGWEIYYTTTPYDTITTVLTSTAQLAEITGVEIVNNDIFISTIDRERYTTLERYRIRYNTSGNPTSVRRINRIAMGSLSTRDRDGAGVGTLYRGLLRNPPSDLLVTATRLSRGASILVQLEDLTSISSIESVTLTASDGTVATIELVRRSDYQYNLTQTRNNNRWRVGSVTVIYNDGDNVRRTLTANWSV